MQTEQLAADGDDSPHPQSRLALLLLNERLQKEQFARKRVMDMIPLKREFALLQLSHRLRKIGAQTRREVRVVFACDPTPKITVM